MKILWNLFLLSLGSSLLANYAYTNENLGKIDMHGGKKQNLLDKKTNFSSKTLQDGLNVSKPKKPLVPDTLIKNKEEKKDLKKSK